MSFPIYERRIIQNRTISFKIFPGHDPLPKSERDSSNISQQMNLPRVIGFSVSDKTITAQGVSAIPYATDAQRASVIPNATDVQRASVIPNATDVQGTPVSNTPFKHEYTIAGTSFDFYVPVDSHLPNPEKDFDNFVWRNPQELGNLWLKSFNEGTNLTTPEKIEESKISDLKQKAFSNLAKAFRNKEINKLLECFQEKNFAKLASDFQNLKTSKDFDGIINNCNNFEETLNIARLGIENTLQKIKIEDYQKEIFNIRKIANELKNNPKDQKLLEKLNSNFDNMTRKLESRKALNELLNELDTSEEELENEIANSKTII